MKIIAASGVSSLDFACEVLGNDGLVAFPTETVYGLGGNAYSDKAVAEIFRCKNRPFSNPVSVCYSSFFAISRDVEVNAKARLLAEEFLPGALTIVLRKRTDSKISRLCSAGGDTVGIRVPNNPVALNLLKKLDFPLAAPSANTSSELSTTTAQSVCESLKNYENLVILDGGPCNLGIESTIIDLSEENRPKILRKGAISQEEIERKCGFKLVAAGIQKIVGTQISAGTGRTVEVSRLSHYKPVKPIVINVRKIEEGDALLAFGNPIPGAKYCLNLSENSDLAEAAKNLFFMLRKLDSTDARRICVMPIPNTEIGAAINDRLEKATQKDN
ncbi:MAG: threonylcarbamoyl-AMP synthase [Alphaproteobacteria bacterium]|nr:threonylcarbamoyl-AMP synthase [Alphaproteobacteria bacterium]